MVLNTYFVKVLSLGLLDLSFTVDFIVNLKAARALGIKVPQVILLQASNVIE